jgi:hypothetical protein
MDWTKLFSRCGGGWLFLVYLLGVRFLIFGMRVWFLPDVVGLFSCV